MTVTFSDTAYYVAILNRRDALHSTAVAFSLGYAGRFVTTEFVLIEVANFFNRPTGRPAFIALVNNLRAAGNVDIIPASTELFDRGFQLFSSRPDKDWSLTDCISFVVMADLGLSDALTADRHFEQAGFTALFA